MSQTSLKQVMQKIRKVVYHVGAFDQSFPRILKGTPEYTRSHLVLLRDCLPDLKHLLRYTANTVPAVAQMMGLVDRGTADLVRASAALSEVRKSTEGAVNEIFEVLDRVHPLLEKAVSAEGSDVETRQTLTEARAQLTLILNALQFQDITAQQIEATNAILADLGKGLATLIAVFEEKVEDLPQIEVLEGTFDPNASFDRDRANVDQADIDRLVEGHPTENSSDTGEPENPKQASAAIGVSELPDATEEQPAEVSGETVSQDEIDALLSG